MKYTDFVGNVQNRARVGSQGEAVRATRATLETLAQRLHGGEAKNLAAQLPAEVGIYLKHDGDDEAFGIEEFYQRVGEKEGVDFPEAVHHARAVVSVVKDAVSQGELDDVGGQLPAEFSDLFDVEIKGEQ